MAFLYVQTITYYTVVVLYFYIEQFTFFPGVGGRRNGSSCVWLTSEEAVNEEYFPRRSCATAAESRTECR